MLRGVITNERSGIFLQSAQQQQQQQHAETSDADRLRLVDLCAGAECQLATTITDRSRAEPNRAEPSRAKPNRADSFFPELRLDRRLGRVHATTPEHPSRRRRAACIGFSSSTV